MDAPVTGVEARVLEHALLVVVVCAAVVTAISAGTLVYIAVKMNRVHRQVSEFIAATGEELLPAVKQAQQALGEVDLAAREMRGKLDRADRIMQKVERLIDGTTLALAISRTIKGSGSTAAGLLEGIKEGLRILRKPATDRKGTDHGRQL